jgi:hypothetical protein
LLFGKKKGSFCCKGELPGIDSCYVFFHCANDYVMASSVFWLELGLIKGWCWRLMMPKGDLSCRIKSI